MHEAALDDLAVRHVLIMAEDRGGGILKSLLILVEYLHLVVAMGHCQRGMRDRVSRGVMHSDRHRVVVISGIV
jgi:hypothetical protein